MNRTLHKWMAGLVTGVLALSLTACGGGGTGGGASGGGEKKLVIYTGRDKSVTDTVIRQFKEKYPDYDVQVLTMGAQQILERVRGEKANPQADVWWGGTQAALMTAADEDLLEPVQPSFAESIPSQYKDAQGRWYGEMLLPEVIMYNSQALKKEEAPKDWDDLLDPKYKGKIIIRSVLASGTMRTIYSAMIYRQNPEHPSDPTKGYEWLKKLDANTKEYAQDPTNLYLKLARQEGTVTLWDLQDVLIQKEKQKQPFDFVIPQSGVPILVDGAAVIKGAKHKDAAMKFLEFLFDQNTQIELAKTNFQIPTRRDISKDKMPEWYQQLELKPMVIDWKLLAQKEKEWMQYWDENIKGKGGQ
ncbi:MAG: extracellular solute-binding protein [Alicyclobacillaceae bacterium]|nr:extracellular solute-binding protein [Alicyclobacillaceae bacterium]